MINPTVNNTTPAYTQAPAHQASSVSKTDFESYVKANDVVMQNQMTNITDLLTKIINSNQASTSSSGSLPSNTIANPKGELKAITTRSGIDWLKEAQHKMEYERRVNERQIQTTEEKTDTSNALDALDASSVIIESNRTESKEQDTSSRSGNDAHVDDADIRPIYNRKSHG
ncbi:hypothetical protein Tco_1377216 [Tanacetum coccineum]